MICCVCLQENSSTLNIFDGNDDSINIAKVLAKHFWFEPYLEDSISNVICYSCWQKVDDFHQFYTEVEQAHAQLTGTKFASISEVNITNHFLEKIQTTTAVEQLEVDNNIKEELIVNVWPEDIYQDDNATGSTKAELNPLEVVETKRNKKIKKSETKPPDDEDKQKPRRKSKKRATSLPHKSVKGAKRLKKKVIADGDEDLAASKEDRSKVVTSKKSKQRDEDLAASKDDRSKVVTSKKSKQQCQRITERDKQLVKKYITMGCELCPYVAEDFTELTDHFRYQHNISKPYVMCCGRKLNKRYLVVHHAYKHEDPEDNNFATDQLLQIHKSSRPTRAANICHVCAKEIRGKKAFEKHVRLHFEDSGPRIKCPHPDCDSWLKDRDNLKQHLRRHHNDDGINYICKHCNKSCKNRRSLTSHIYNVHGNETFSCEECNKTFKKAITLREHMARHAGERLYNCPFCTRTFNSKGNMHTHKTKMHPIEWDNWRKTKNGSSQRLITEAVTSIANSVNNCVQGNNAFNDSKMLEPNSI